MQYKVPQNIDLEDKIVGPFTMKQFLYLFVGGFILYGWWNYANGFVSPSPLTIFLPLAIPVGLLCFCLAIVKMNDRPFEYFILNVFKFLFSPRSRRWVTGYFPEAVITLDPLETAKKPEAAKTESDLDSLAKSLEQQTSKLQAEASATQIAKASASKPQNINLSVSDLSSASQKQQQAQATTTPKSAPEPAGQKPPEIKKKKGFLSIFN